MICSFRHIFLWSHNTTGTKYDYSKIVLVNERWIIEYILFINWNLTQMRYFWIFNRKGITKGNSMSDGEVSRLVHSITKKSSFSNSKRMYIYCWISLSIDLNLNVANERKSADHFISHCKMLFFVMLFTTIQQTISISCQTQYKTKFISISNDYTSIETKPFINWFYQKFIKMNIHFPWSKTFY
jgi:hypothetical protein